MLNNITLTTEVIEGEMSLSNQTSVFISSVNDDQNHFTFNEDNGCFRDENQGLEVSFAQLGRIPMHSFMN